MVFGALLGWGLPLGHRVLEAARVECDGVRLIGRMGPFLSLRDPFVLTVLLHVVVVLGIPVALSWWILGARVELVPAAIGFVAGRCIGTLARRVRLRPSAVRVLREQEAQADPETAGASKATLPYRIVPRTSPIDTATLRRSERPYAAALLEAANGADGKQSRPALRNDQ